MRLLLAAVALLASACSPSGGAGAKEEPFTPVAISPYLDEAVLGDSSAPVTIIEYASTTCTHCKAFHDQILPQLKSRYIDTGKAKLFYRTLPTEPAEASVAGAALARCASEAQFYPVIDDLFAAQDEVFDQSRSANGLRELMTRLGSRHGLSPDEVRTCITDPKIRAYIRKVALDAPAFVDSTPTLIVNGTEVEPHGLDDLTKALDAALATAPPPPAKP